MKELLQLGVFELYQILFVASIAYLILNLFNLGFKMYGNIKLNNKAKYVLAPVEKFGLLVAFAITMSYLI